MLSRNQAPPLAEAIALGVLHGPAELLPISSSGHISLVPWLLGWRYGELEPELRKAFEIALHAGTAAALLITLRGEVGEAMLGLDRRRLALLALSFLPPAVVGFTLERPIERRLGTPGTVAAGLLVGSAAMAWGSEWRSRARSSPGSPATAPPSPPPACGASRARTPTGSPATWPFP